MTWAEYRRMTAEAMIGRKVELMTRINNRYMKLEVGARGTIRAKWKGLEINFDRCPVCGSAPIVSRISPSDIKLLPESPGPAPQCNRTLHHAGGVYRCLRHSGHEPDAHIFQLPDVDTRIEVTADVD